MNQKRNCNSLLHWCHSFSFDILVASDKPTHAISVRLARSQYLQIQKYYEV